MMKNLNGRAHNACYHPYYQQQLQQQQPHEQQQQQLLMQQHQQHMQQQQLNLPYAAQYNQLQQQQQQHQQQYSQQQYYNQQLLQQQQQQQQQLLRQQQQQQQLLPTQSAYQQQQSKQSYVHTNNSSNNNNNNINNANMALTARGNMHAATVAATVNANVNSNSNANTNTATAAMAAVCQMQSFLSQQQQQQHQQHYNNNCAHINYNQQQQQQLPATSAAATTTTINGDKLALDSASEIANFLASELFMQQLVTFDGMQSAPTLTTPTLTPTTLRTIEETIYELTSEPQNVPFQAGFKPPPLTSLCNVTVNNNNNNNNSNNNNINTITTTTAGNLTLSNVVNTNALNANPQFDLLGLNCGSIPESDSEDSNGSWREGQLNDDQSTTDTSSAATDSTSYQNGGHMLGNNNNGSNGSAANNFTAALAAVNSARRGNSSSTSNSATPARRGGGRRPNKSANMSPEEEEKRRIRRERNKLAAARCRKRRVDQTNELTDEVDLLIKKGDDMKKEIEILNATKHQLEYVLQVHRPTCQKVRDDMLSVVTCNGLIAPAAMLSAGSTASNNSSHHNNNNNNNSNNNNSNSNDSSCGTITGFDASLNSTGRSNSPLDLKPVLTNEQLLQHIKHEPQDGGLDSGSSLDQDGPPAAKRFALPNIATLNASLTTPTGAVSSLNTPLTGTAPVSFDSFVSGMSGIASPTLNALNKLATPKTRPNTLNVQQPFLQPSIDGKAPTQIEGVPIQTPSAGNFNFDSLMAGGTGLTPVSGPLVPTCSSQNKHPLELPTPTSEPSKLVSL